MRCSSSFVSKSRRPRTRSGLASLGIDGLEIATIESSVETKYAHLLRSDVTIGDKVSQGQMIGWMGRSGHATGVQLHFEIVSKSRDEDGGIAVLTTDPFGGTQ